MTSPGKHGTLNSYNRGCRCDACWTRMADYRRAKRAAKGVRAGEGMRGSSIRVDWPVLEAAIARSGRGVVELEKLCGISRGGFSQIAKRGGCKLQTADRLTQVLDIDLWEFDLGYREETA